MAVSDGQGGDGAGREHGEAAQGHDAHLQENHGHDTHAHNSHAHNSHSAGSSPQPGSGPVIPDKAHERFTAPFLDRLLSVPGLDVYTTTVDQLLTWGSTNSFFIFPMATSCCGIELMAAAASRVDLDRMGSFLRGTPRQCDVMVVAGTITVKMAPRVRRLWDQMPEPKWCVAMGSCAISGDFYRDIYSVVPGIDVFLPVDVYIPGCPPNPDMLFAGLQRLQEKIKAKQTGLPIPKETRPETSKMFQPALKRLGDPERDPVLTQAQRQATLSLGLNGNESRSHDHAAPGSLSDGMQSAGMASEPSEVEV